MPPQVEVLMLRHQFPVGPERSRCKRLGLTRADRPVWVWFSRARRNGQPRSLSVKLDTGDRVAPSRFPPVLDVEKPWSSGREVAVCHEVGTLIRTISEANPLWDALRIHGELREV